MDRKLILSGLALILIGAAECSAADAPKQALVVACEPGAKDCATERKKKDTSGGPSGDPTPGESPSDPVTPAPDAGAPPPPDAGALGYSCTALQACCEALSTAGITGSARQCKDVVA
ncbi:hypothetical protein BH11MYX4_BH11MYX4_37590 [soil metagenome]